LSLGATMADAAGEVGIVRASKLNIRPSPGTEEPPLVTIPRGTRVEVLSSDENWIKVRYEDISGYVRNRDRYIRILTNDDPQPAAVEAEVTETASAPSGTQDPLDQAKSKAESINQEIELFEKKVQDDTQKESEIIASLQSTDRKIAEAREKAANLATEMKAIDQRIAAAQEEIRRLIHLMEKNEDYAATRLVALYKMNWLGRIHILASAETIHDFFQRKYALERVLAKDEKMRQSLIDSRNRVSGLLVELNAKKKEKQLVEVDYKAQVRRETNRRNQKKALLKKIRGKKTLELAAIENLKKDAAELDKQIAALSRAAVEPRAGTPAQEEPFPNLKGLLKMPVNGKIVTSFGKYRDPEFNVTHFRTGITIQADRGDPVHSVCGGTVLYAEWFKGYGNMLIIDHGENYYTLYAHNEELFKSKGDFVEKGEVIATVGDSGSMIGPALHFEVRHHGKPQDPAVWLEKG